MIAGDSIQARAEASVIARIVRRPGLGPRMPKQPRGQFGESIFCRSKARRVKLCEAMLYCISPASTLASPTTRPL